MVEEGDPLFWRVVETGTPTYVGNSIIVVVPLPLLEGYSFDTAANVRIALGPWQPGPPTDCAPNNTWVESVPAPRPLPLLEEPGVILLGISLLAVGGLLLLGKKRLFRPA